MGQSRPLLVYFRPFLITISIMQIEKSIDGMLGIRTQGRRMVGADETTELWHFYVNFVQLKNDLNDIKVTFGVTSFMAARYLLQRGQSYKHFLLYI